MEERKRLESIRAELGDMKSEAKPFDVHEPIKITQVYSSIAAHGSGEFHLYRKLRAQEEERQKQMDEEWDSKVASLELAKRRAAEKAVEDDERHERSTKRQKKKQTQRENRAKAKLSAMVPACERGEWYELELRKQKLRELAAANETTETNINTDDTQTNTQTEQLKTDDTVVELNPAPTAAADVAVEDDVLARLNAAKARLREISLQEIE